MYSLNVNNPFLLKRQSRLKSADVNSGRTDTLDLKNDRTQNIQEILLNMKSIVVHASQEGQHDKHKDIGNEDIIALESCLKAINRVARVQTSSTKTEKYSVSFEGSGVQIIDQPDSFVEDNVLLKVTQAPKNASLTSKPLFNDVIQTDDAFTFIENGKSVLVNVLKGQLIKDVSEVLNLKFNSQGLILRVRLSDSNEIIIEHKKEGSSYNFLVRTKTNKIFKVNTDMIGISNVGADIQGFMGDEFFNGSGSNIRFDRDSKFAGMNVQSFKKTEELIKLTSSVNFKVEGPYNPFSTYELGKGVFNTSGFNNLSEIKIYDFNQMEDCLSLIQKSLEDISIMKEAKFAQKKRELNASKSWSGSKENGFSINASNSFQLAHDLRVLIEKDTKLALLVQASQLSKSTFQLVA